MRLCEVTHRLSKLNKWLHLAVTVSLEDQIERACCAVPPFMATECRVVAQRTLLVSLKVLLLSHLQKFSRRISNAHHLAFSTLLAFASIFARVLSLILPEFTACVALAFAFAA